MRERDALTHVIATSGNDALNAFARTKLRAVDFAIAHVTPTEAALARSAADRTGLAQPIEVLDVPRPLSAPTPTEPLHDARRLDSLAALQAFNSARYEDVASVSADLDRECTAEVKSSLVALQAAKDRLQRGALIQILPAREQRIRSRWDLLGWTLSVLVVAFLPIAAFKAFIGGEAQMQTIEFFIGATAWIFAIRMLHAHYGDRLC